MKKAFTCIFALLHFVHIGSAAAAADLEITVQGVRNSTGSILLTLYDGPDKYLKTDLAKIKLKAEAVPGAVRFVVHDLPAGTYAISSFHDEKGTGKLEKNFLGIPTEGYGFSNDAEGLAGPPSFEQAGFFFDGKTDKSVGFSLNY